MLKRSTYITSHLQTVSYLLDGKLTVDPGVWKGYMFCLCHGAIEKTRCALEWQDSLWGLVLRVMPQCPVGHKLVDSGNHHQRHFGMMVHPSPGASKPWVTLPEFPARKYTRTLKRNPQTIQGIWLWGYPYKSSKGLAGAQPEPGFPGHLEGSVRTPKWQLKVTELLGLCSCFKSMHPGQASPFLSSRNMCLSLFPILSAVLCSKLHCTVLHCIWFLVLSECLTVTNSMISVYSSG